MKKQDVLKQMRETAICAMQVDENWKNSDRGRDRVTGTLMGLYWLSTRLFGHESEEGKEFDDYFEKRYEEMPQPEDKNNI